MEITLVAYSENVAAAIVQQDIDAVPDEHVRTEGKNIVIPKLNKIVGIHALGVDIRNVQLVSPSLRDFALHDVAPVEITDLPVFPPDFFDCAQNPIDLETDEQLIARAGNSNVGAQDEHIIIALSDSVITPLQGQKVRTIECTATAPAVANTWQNAQLTLLQTLPVGDYKVIGARCEQANTRAFRLVFVGGQWRPGHLAVASISAKSPKGSRFGEMGVWGKFSHLTPPSIDFFGDGTGGAAIIYLDLVKV